MKRLLGLAGLLLAGGATCLYSEYRELTRQKRELEEQLKQSRQQEWSLAAKIEEALADLEQLQLGPDTVSDVGQRFLLESTRERCLRLVEESRDLQLSARCQEGGHRPVEVCRQAMGVHSLTQALVAGFTPLARKKGVSVLFHGGAEVTRMLDPYLWERAVFQLMSAVLERTAHHGWLDLRLSVGDSSISLLLGSSGPTSPADEMEAAIRRVQELAVVLGGDLKFAQQPQHGGHIFRLTVAALP